VGDAEAGVLDGIRVVDLSPDRVGAQASQTLADFGADVIWVERPGGSPLRRQPSFPFLARGKRSVVLDLRKADDVATARELAANADVLIETCRPGVVERLGLGYDDLAETNPGLVYASITGFGRQGPYANVKGYEGLVAAKLGVNAAFARMHSGAHPPYLGAPWCSFAASQNALQGILAALLERERSGRGQHVEANLAQGFACLDTWAWYLHLVAQRWPDAYVAVSSFNEKGIPASPFPFMLLAPLTKDGRWLQFAQVAPHLFHALMRALGLEWMFADPEWKGIPVFEDEERRAGLWQRMLLAAREKTLAEWHEVFEGNPNVFAELFRRGPEVLTHPQLVHDGHVVEIVDPVLGAVRQPGPLVDMVGLPTSVGRPAPRLNQHADAMSDPSAERRPTPRSDTVPAAGLPLEGITVLELAVLFAAPYGATLLADLGARVIKVEPLGGDPIRMMVAFPEAGGAKVMQGKESVAVDITTPEGRDIVLELARRADIVLECFRAGVTSRHGIDAKSLRAVNPDLLHLSASGYGPGGPHCHRPAFAPSIAAAGGIAGAQVGDAVPERADLDIDEIREGSIRLTNAGTVSSAQADGFAALGVASSMLLGLLARARGKGAPQMFSSMLHTATHAMADHVVDYPGNPGPPSPGADLRGPHALYRIYDAADGWVFLAAPREHEWNALADALSSRADLRTDPRFATEADRRHNDKALSDILTALFAEGTKADWERELLAADVGCVAVTTDPIESMLMSDWFGRASGYLVDVTHPTFDTHPRLAPAVRFSRSTTQAKPGVLNGSSTDAVLRELGCSDHRIADLRARKIIG
jgi:crotonobetainyl-CoA:carnitine CoA-transferase CaiB-like acyl-CoA transferase